MSKNKYEIRIPEKEEYKEWNELVDYYPVGTIFHKSHLLKCI